MTKSKFLKNQYSDTSEDSPSLLNSDVSRCYLEYYQFQNNCEWYDSGLSEMISEGTGSEVNVWEEMIEQGLRPPSVVGVYLGLGEGDSTLFNTNTTFHHLIPWIFSQLRTRSETTTSSRLVGAGSINELLFKLSGGLVLTLNEPIIQGAGMGKYPSILCPWLSITLNTQWVCATYPTEQRSSNIAT